MYAQVSNTFAQNKLTCLSFLRNHCIALYMRNPCTALCLAEPSTTLCIPYFARLNLLNYNKYRILLGGSVSTKWTPYFARLSLLKHNKYNVFSAVPVRSSDLLSCPSKPLCFFALRIDLGKATGKCCRISTVIPKCQIAEFRKLLPEFHYIPKMHTYRIPPKCCRISTTITKCIKAA